MKKLLTLMFMLSFVIASAFITRVHIVKADDEIVYDSNMDTKNYKVDIVIGEDGSYTVTETWKVRFKKPSHGIYRYIPFKGKVQSYNEKGKLQSLLYFADFEMLSNQSGTDLEESSENGSKVLRFGDEDKVVTGGTYRFSYRLIPKYQGDTYNYLYYNIFPSQWQNSIPKGSSFTIHFPKKTDFDKIQFYYGAYGDSKNAQGIMDLNRDEAKGLISGTLKKDLKFQSGLTCYGQMPEGYFSQNHEIQTHRSVLIAAWIIFGLVTGLYFFFGRDEKIIPSVQYQPPEGLDSAAVGYILDGAVDSQDVISLILYWADRGYLRIEETGKKDVTFRKLRDIPKSEPKYQIYMFKELFGKKKKVKASSLKYKFADAISVVKDKIRFRYRRKIYTSSSKVARILSMVLIQIPVVSYFIMMCYYGQEGVMDVLVPLLLWGAYVAAGIFACVTVDKWYAMDSGARKASVLGTVVLAVVGLVGSGVFYNLRIRQDAMFDFFQVYLILALLAGIELIYAAFMKKRTKECIHWMGYLVGLRDFIETAELDRMKAIGKEHPGLFYHILPYAMVFGLFDLYAKKLDVLKVPAPEWYGYDSDLSYFHYYMIGNCMHHAVRDNLTAVKAAETAGSGVSGGGFSGGGFSGGGFGGGGGGSW